MYATYINRKGIGYLFYLNIYKQYSIIQACKNYKTFFYNYRFKENLLSLNRLKRIYKNFVLRNIAINIFISI